MGGLTRREMTHAVECVFAVGGSENELQAIWKCLEESLPHPGIIDLIYYPDQDPTPEEMVDEAIRRERAHNPSFASPAVPPNLEPPGQLLAGKQARPPGQGRNARARLTPPRTPAAQCPRR